MNKKVQFNKNPFLIVVSYYIGVILAGTLLLKLPFLFADGQKIDWLDSFFMSNSAIATTGLVTFDFTTTYNYLGWFVLIVMFNLGGMGIIVINTVVSLLIKKKIGYKNRVLAKLDYNQTSQVKIVGVLKSIVIYFLAVEAVTTFFIFIKLLPQYDSVLDAFMNSLFMISSAISGSGFYNTVPFATDYYVQFFVIIGMIFSFIGYPVIVDVHDYFVNKIKKEKFKFSRFTKIAVSVNAITVVLFAIIFFLIERQNEMNVAMQNIGILEQVQWSFYMSFSMKSVGLNLFSDLDSLSSLTLIFATIFMLIGGSPSSACGGIRVGAIYLIYKHITSVLKGESEVISYGYIASSKNILRAYVITFMYFFISFVATVVIYIINRGISVFDIWFDVVSGFTTTGFSTGALAQFNELSVFIIAILMGIGRIGILNIVAINTYRKGEKKGLVKYLEKDVTI